MIINWSGISNRSPLGKLLRFPLRGLPKNKVMRVRRGAAKGMKWVVGSGTHGCWLGTYELDKQGALERMVCPGMTVYDIGAHAGFYTLIFSRLVGEPGRVYAFEPFADNARYLLTHLRINNIQNSKLLQVAVADVDGLSDFSVTGDTFQNALTKTSHSVFQVASVTLDQVVDDYGLSPPDLVKMDVEGGEAGILAGARQVLSSYRPILFIAMHGDSQRRSCQQCLTDAGYKLFDLEGKLLSGELVIDEVYALPY